jgi:hypothetical protein
MKVVYYGERASNMMRWEDDSRKICRRDGSLHGAGTLVPRQFLLSMGVAPCAISWRDEVVRHAGIVGQSMMFGWNETGRQPEASWNEFSTIYRALLKKVSVSEIDREERPVCYTCVPSDTCVEKTVLDFPPITFLSCFFFQSAKGRRAISIAVNSAIL